LARENIIFKQTTEMPFPRCLSIAAIFCCLVLDNFGQGADWKPLQLDIATFHYPPSWQMLKAAHGNQTLIRLTPDSMASLTMKMVEIFDAPLTEKYDYKWFKGHFSQVILPALGSGGKILETKEITFHNHACIYADAVMNGLPVKVYALDGLFYAYILLLTQRRYSQVPNPALERDEMAILNSITYKL
jgi:hypothetical protein